MPGAGVADLHHQHPVVHHGLDVHAAAARGELHRVPDQVRQDLLHARAVEQQRLRHLGVAGAVHALRHRGRPDRLHHVLQDRTDGGGLELQPQLARDHARHVEQIRRQLRLELGGAFDGAERPLVPLRRELPGLQQMNPPHQRVERRAELVRQRRQELVLQPIGLLRLAVELLVLAGEPPQPILGALQLADVEERTHRATHLALVVEQRRRVLVERQRRAIGVHHLELDVLHLDPQACRHLQRQVVGGDRLAVAA